MIQHIPSSFTRTPHLILKEPHGSNQWPKTAKIEILRPQSLRYWVTTSSVTACLVTASFILVWYTVVLMDNASSAAKRMGTCWMSPEGALLHRSDHNSMRLGKTAVYIIFPWYYHIITLIQKKEILIYSIIILSFYFNYPIILQYLTRAGCFISIVLVDLRT